VVAFGGAGILADYCLKKLLLAGGFNFSLLREYKKNGFFCFSVLGIFYFVFLVCGFSFFSCGNLLLR
jgi:hypothetical protein